MKRMVMALTLLTIGFSPLAWADEEPGVAPHVFDDLNGDGVSDTRIPDASAGSNSSASQLTDDEDQTPISYDDSSSSGN